MAQRRSRFGKPFFSCSNFPDCDVIVNNLDDLNEKYPNHPKTAYVKKPGKFGKGKGKGKAGKGEKEAPAAKKGKAKKPKAKSTRAQKAYAVSKELEAVVGAKELSRLRGCQKNVGIHQEARLAG